MKKILIRILIGVLLIGNISAFFFLRRTGEISGRGSIATEGRSNENVEYFWYIPARPLFDQDLPILVVVPGLNGSGSAYIQGPWRQFARENGFVIISPTFTHDDEDWQKEQSYQYAPTWAKEVMLQAIDELGEKVRLNKNNLFLFGVSAGAQYAHRFALWRPDICKAVAMHAPGTVMLPQKRIPVQFFISIGQMDSTRIDGVREFVKVAQDLGISVIYKEYPGMGHGLVEDQVQRSLAFFQSLK